MEIGKKIATARKYHRPALTQYELARAVNVSRTTLSKWEAGNQDAPRRHIERVATITGIPVDWFYDGKDTPPPKPSAEILSADDTKQVSKTPAHLIGATVALPVWQGVLAGLDGECTFSEDG